MATLAFSETIQDEIIRKACEKIGLVCQDREDCKTMLAAYTNIAKSQNWETMSMSTAQGAGILDAAYVSGCYDGRYLYYAPSNSVTYVRYDSTKSFTDAASWEKINASTVLGGSTAGRHHGCVFDGRYIHYGAENVTTFIRYDISQGFTTTLSWTTMSLSTALKADPGTSAHYSGIVFDGRYVYHIPRVLHLLPRFDTNLSFTNSSAWEVMSVSTVMGGFASDCFIGSSFDGRYVYMVPFNSDTFLRYDTTQTFTNSSSWERISMSVAQNSSTLDVAYHQACFDGRFVYMVPLNSDTFLRFDSTGTFTSSSAWERMSISTVQGAAAVDVSHSQCVFDGRFVIYTAYNSDTFVRFDTTLAFTNSSAWERISMSTAQGAALLDYAYNGVMYDGKYAYFVPFYADTFLRVLATPR